MLRHICVAYNPDDERAGWALDVAREVAARASSRLTIVHVLPPVDEPADVRERLLAELVGLPGDTGRRRLEAARAAAAVEGIEAHVRVLAGSVHFQVLELLRQVRPDLLVVGTRALRGVRRVVAPRLRHALLAAAPCPVMLVRTPPRADHEPVVLLCGRAVNPGGRNRYHGGSVRRGTGLEARARRASTPGAPARARLCGR